MARARASRARRLVRNPRCAKVPGDGLETLRDVLVVRPEVKLAHLERPAKVDFRGPGVTV